MLHPKVRIVVTLCVAVEATELLPWKNWSGVSANTTGAVTSNAKRVGHGSMPMNVTEGLKMKNGTTFTTTKRKKRKENTSPW